MLRREVMKGFGRWGLRYLYDDIACFLSYFHSLRAVTKYAYKDLAQVALIDRSCLAVSVVGTSHDKPLAVIKNCGQFSDCPGGANDSPTIDGPDPARGQRPLL